MTTLRTHFTFRVDTWTPDGESIVEHLAGVEDYQVALATYRAACERWPGTLFISAHTMRVPETPPFASYHGSCGGVLVLVIDARPPLAIGTECTAVVLEVKVRQEPSSVSLCPP